MKRNFLFLLFALVCFAGNISAQTAQHSCATDVIRQRLLTTHPEILNYEATLEQQIKESLHGIDYSKAARTTSVDESGNPDFWYDVPIVVHIIHDYSVEYLSDDSIFNFLKDWNIVYSKQNYDTAYVIKTYKGLIPNSNVWYIGNIHIRLHLATIDPDGNPTKGITRHRSYLTYTGGEPSKLDQWPPTSYVNIWSVNTMSAGNEEAAAYAFEPPEGASLPQGDGIIALYNYMPDVYNGADDGVPASASKTIPHEMGHIFNLYHPWGNTNGPQIALGDDGVDDTPPTWGHEFGNCDTTDGASDDNSLYDTMFATNYYKIYTSATGTDSLVNYPDTTNAQNIMDYTYCSRMFTYGQAARMHAALNSDIAGRDNLWDSTNLVFTGALAPVPDLKPIPEFSATNSSNGTAANPGNYMSLLDYFTIPGAKIYFHNETWNDTIESITWKFSNTATQPTVTYSSPGTVNTVFSNSFADAGWVNMSMTAQGNNSGDTTVTWPRAVFVANKTATPGANYYQEFSGSDTAQWPMFNYYNNNFQWQYANVGYYDNSSIEYNAFDSRIFPANYTGMPSGDVDDLFSIPFDLSAYTGDCSISYYFSGASRSSTSTFVDDELDIDYSTNGTTWTNLAKLTKKEIDNKGAVATAYTPQSMNDWSLMSINIPTAARTSYTVFRFRYMPVIDPTSGGSSNNFYMDRISFSPWPASVNNVQLGNMDVAVAPNPTNGDAYVVIKDAGNSTAKIVVTDITGKVVYTASQELTNNEAHILIPHSAIAVAGMYIVQAITGNQVQTRKLVVE